MLTPNPAPTPADHQITTVLGGAALRAVAQLFDEVPIDPYVADGTRAKSLYRTARRHGQLAVGPHDGLYQSAETNPTHGGYVRRYPATAPALVALLEPVVRHFVDGAGLADGEEVLVQAQRITATAGRDGRSGQPAVEGWHQDQVDLLGILVVARQNISGGVTMLSDSKGSFDAVLGTTLGPGDLLMFPDRPLWHFTSRIRAVDRTRPAYRDVVLLASPGCRPPSLTETAA